MDPAAPGTDHEAIHDKLGQLHQIVAALAQHPPLHGYALLHGWCYEALISVHGAAGDLHTRHIAGLCIAEVWHILHSHQVSVRRKVHAIESALGRHFGIGGRRTRGSDHSGPRVGHSGLARPHITTTDD
jgi:hypothetical protein